MQGNNTEVRVLVIDDDIATLEEVADALEGFELEVYFATSGEEAVALARKTTPDMVITDFLLPGINGLDTIELMKEFIPDCTYLMITAHRDYCLDVVHEHSDSFFVAEKPISIDMMIFYIKSALKTIHLPYA